MIEITFPDGNKRQYESGATPKQIAESISPRFAADVLAAKVNGAEWDISRPIAEDAKIELFKWDDPEGKHAFGIPQPTFSPKPFRSFIQA